MLTGLMAGNRHPGLIFGPAGSLRIDDDGLGVLDWVLVVMCGVMVDGVGLPVFLPG